VPRWYRLVRLLCSELSLILSSLLLFACSVFFNKLNNNNNNSIVLYYNNKILLKQIFIMYDNYSYYQYSWFMLTDTKHFTFSIIFTFTIKGKRSISWCVCVCVCVCIYIYIYIYICIYIILYACLMFLFKHYLNIRWLSECYFSSLKNKRQAVSDITMLRWSSTRSVEILWGLWKSPTIKSTIILQLTAISGSWLHVLLCS